MSDDEDNVPISKMVALKRQTMKKKPSFAPRRSRRNAKKEFAKESDGDSKSGRDENEDVVEEKDDKDDDEEEDDEALLQKPKVHAAASSQKQGSADEDQEDGDQAEKEPMHEEMEDTTAAAPEVQTTEKDDIGQETRLSVEEDKNVEAAENADKNEQPENQVEDSSQVKSKGQDSHVDAVNGNESTVPEPPEVSSVKDQDTSSEKVDDANPQAQQFLVKDMESNEPTDLGGEEKTSNVSEKESPSGETTKDVHDVSVDSSKDLKDAKFQGPIEEQGLATKDNAKEASTEDTETMDPTKVVELSPQAHQQIDAKQDAPSSSTDITGGHPINSLGQEADGTAGGKADSKTRAVAVSNAPSLESDTRDSGSEQKADVDASRSGIVAYNEQGAAFPIPQEAALAHGTEQQPSTSAGDKEESTPAGAIVSTEGPDPSKPISPEQKKGHEIGHDEVNPSVNTTQNSAAALPMMQRATPNHDELKVQSTDMDVAGASVDVSVTTKTTDGESVAAPVSTKSPVGTMSEITEEKSVKSREQDLKGEIKDHDAMDFEPVNNATEKEKGEPDTSAQEVKVSVDRSNKKETDQQGLLQASDPAGVANASAKALNTATRKPISAADEAAALLDAFPLMVKRKTIMGSFCKKPKKQRRQHLHVNIASVPAPSTMQREGPTQAVPDLKDDTDPMKFFDSGESLDSPSFSDVFASESMAEDFVSRYERELEASLLFFGQTHEEQDPSFIEFRRKKEEGVLKDELENLKKTFEAGILEINEIIARQMKEKQASADRNIERLRSKAAIEEQKDLQRLHQVYKEKAASNNNKISQGIKLLTRRQSQEVQKAHLAARQQAQHRGAPDITPAEWAPIAQRLQAKQQRQLQEFNAKGEEVKTKFEAEYAREKEKYIKHHERRKREMENSMQKVITRMRSNFQQQHQRYLKRHASRIKERRKEILSRLGETATEKPSDSAADTSSADVAEKPELRSPSPVKSHRTLAGHFESTEANAAARYKHRKGILSTIHKQLSVEIHNEGLWISMITDKNSKGEESKKEGDKRMSDASAKIDNRNGQPSDSEFIPWSAKARAVLQSIVCGEIPSDYGTDRFDFGDMVASQGGHIRCVVVDLRTSEETASAQRAAAMKEQDTANLMDLEEKAEKLSQAVAEAEKQSSKAAAEENECAALHEKTLIDVEKAKSSMQQLRNKFKDLLSPDDVPSDKLKPVDQQKLSQAIAKFKSSLEAAQARETAAQSALLEKKARSQKMVTTVKQAQKTAAAASATLRKKRALLNEIIASPGKGRPRLSDAAETERAAARVNDVISALHKTAESRRDQLNQKRSSSASSTWVQALPGLSSALKKSLWHKMHRRRHQIVLRPSMDFVLNDLKQTIEETVSDSKLVSASQRIAAKEEAVRRAEELFLLASYPTSGPEMPSPIPPSNSSDPWAEPGWYVNLDVPNDERKSSRALLPCVPSFPVMQKNHSEYSSVPGRQAASLVKATHLRALNTPLSAIAQAISLAETSPLATEKAKMSDADPLHVSEAAMMTGYTFALKSPSKASASQSRKKPTANDDTDSVEAPPVKRQTSTGSAASKRPSTSARRSSTKTDKPKRSRSKSSLDASPRTKAAKKATAGVVDAASQARNFIQQQAAANALAARGGVYGQQQQQQQQQRTSQASMDQQAAQYNQNFMNQVQSPTQSSHPNLQALQPQQLQQGMPSQQHLQQGMPTQQQLQQGMPTQQQLLPQPHYASPQQQYAHQQQQQQQRQLAQMRMMQQQQSAGRQPGYPQQQPQTPQSVQQMRFFAPPMQTATRQQSYGSQPHMQLPVGRAPQGNMGARGSNAEENPNDPLFMLPDMQP